MPIRSHCCSRGVPFSYCCGLVVACACGSGACWACWGTLSLRSWADFWRVWSAWGLANGSLERLEEALIAIAADAMCANVSASPRPELQTDPSTLLRPGGALQPLLWPCGGFCVREWRVLGLLGYLLPAEVGGLVEDLEGLERLRRGKRQP